MQEEIFGPILPVLAVDGPGEAKAFITARPKPLALYVFAGQDEVIDDMVNNVSSGGVCINQTLMHLLPANLPFGGVGDSGIGRLPRQEGLRRAQPPEERPQEADPPRPQDALPAVQGEDREARPPHPEVARRLGVRRYM